MAELAVVIIVGCCPYIPRFLNSLKSREASSDAAWKRFSTPPKPTGKLNTFDKYLSTRSGMTKLEPTISAEHLEMDQYKGAASQKSGHATEDGANA